MKEAISKIFCLLTGNEKRFALVLLLYMIIGSVLEIFSLGILPGFIAIVSDPNLIRKYKIGNELISIVKINSQQQLIVYGSAIIFLVFVIKNIFITFLIKTRINYIADIQMRLSTKLLSLYYHTDYTFHLNRNSSDLFSKVTDEVRIITNNILLPFITILMDVLFSASTLALLLIFEPTISIITFIIFSCSGLIFLAVTKKNTRKYGEQLTFIRSEMYKRVNEGFGGLKDAKVLNRTSYFKQQIIEAFSEVINATKFQQIISLLTRPFIETIAILGMLSITVIIILQGRPMNEVISVLALFSIAVIRLLPSISQVITGISGIRTFMYTVDPIYKDFVSLKENDSLKHDGNEKQVNFINQISINNLSYRYPSADKNSITELNLTIKKGEAIGLVGSSGAGKTTLVDIILGLLDPIDGSIEVDGLPISQNLSGWQKNIGYIPQLIFLSDNTIKRNIAFGIPENQIDNQKLKNAIIAAQLEKLIEELPNGVDTEIGERGVRLSGGQRQRIGIARALYHNPQVLIMDEATSALDNITEKYVIESIERLKGDRTIITIAHRLTTVKNCDCLYLMKNGQIETKGTYEELVRHSSYFKEMNI